MGAWHWKARFFVWLFNAPYRQVEPLVLDYTVQLWHYFLLFRVHIPYKISLSFHQNKVSTENVYTRVVWLYCNAILLRDQKCKLWIRSCKKFNVRLIWYRPVWWLEHNLFLIFSCFHDIIIEHWFFRATCGAWWTD